MPAILIDRDDAETFADTLVLFEHGRTKTVRPFRCMKAERALELDELSELIGRFARDHVPRAASATTAYRGPAPHAPQADTPARGGVPLGEYDGTMREANGQQPDR